MGNAKSTATGAVSGALGGAMVAGPVGLVAGAVVGGTAGNKVGDKMEKKKQQKAREKALAQQREKERRERNKKKQAREKALAEQREKEQRERNKKTQEFKRRFLQVDGVSDGPALESLIDQILEEGLINSADMVHMDRDELLSCLDPDDLQGRAREIWRRSVNHYAPLINLHALKLHAPLERRVEKIEPLHTRLFGHTSFVQEKEIMRVEKIEPVHTCVKAHTCTSQTYDIEPIRWEPLKTVFVAPPSPKKFMEVREIKKVLWSPPSPKLMEFKFEEIQSVAEIRECETLVEVKKDCGAK